MITLNRTSKVTTSVTLDLEKTSIKDIIAKLQENDIDIPSLKSERELSLFLNQQSDSTLSDIFSCLFDYGSKNEFYSDESDYWVDC